MLLLSDYCPAISPAGATLFGSCNAATIREYDTCTQSCNPPYVRVTGGSAITVRAQLRVFAH